MYYLSSNTTGSVGTVKVLIKSRAITKMQDTENTVVHATYTKMVKIF